MIIIETNTENMSQAINPKKELFEKVMKSNKKVEHLSKAIDKISGMEKNKIQLEKFNLLHENPLLQIQNTINRKLGIEGFTSPEQAKISSALYMSSSLGFDSQRKQMKTAGEVLLEHSTVIEKHITAASLLYETIVANRFSNSLYGTAVGEIRKMESFNQKLSSPLSEMFKKIAVDLSIDDTDRFDDIVRGAFELIEKDSQITEQLVQTVNNTIKPKKIAENEYEVQELLVRCLIPVHKYILKKRIEFQSLYTLTQFLILLVTVYLELHKKPDITITNQYNISNQVNITNQIQFESIPEQIRQFWELKENEIITEYEFEKLKTELLDSL